MHIQCQQRPGLHIILEITLEINVEINLERRIYITFTDDDGSLIYLFKEV